MTLIGPSNRLHLVWKKLWWLLWYSYLWDSGSSNSMWAWL